MMKYYAEKRKMQIQYGRKKRTNHQDMLRMPDESLDEVRTVKSPLLCRELLRNPSKRVKTSTPHLDREGLVPPFQAPFKEKTPVFALHALHTIIYLSIAVRRKFRHVFSAFSGFLIRVPDFFAFFF